MITKLPTTASTVTTRNFTLSCTPKFLQTTMLSVLFFLLLGVGESWGQSTLISPTGDGGFETGATFANNGWTVQNYSSSNTNKWFVGTGASASAGSRCAYIDNGTGSTNAYTVTSGTSMVMFWRDIVFPSGEINVTLSFKFKGLGESSYDDLSVFIQTGASVPAVTQPGTSGIAVPAITNATRVTTLSAVSGTSFTTYTYTLSASNIGNSSSSTTRRLIFFWENDASTGAQPPVSIDEIKLYSMPATAMSGTYTIDNSIAESSTNFKTFTDAINNLNSRGISGAVTFNISAGQTFTENTPTITATGTSANTIKFQKSGSGANPIIKPTGTSGTLDFGININGGDYFTFDGIDIDASASAAVELGYYISNSSSTNGAQYNTIMNSIITLANRGSANLCYGIDQNAVITPTSTAGANSYNNYYNLTISGVKTAGVYLNTGGGSTYPDLSCNVGTTVCATRNSISNIGPTTSTSISARGIYAYGQSGLKLWNNDISSITGDQAATQGIYYTVGYGNSEIYNNKIQGINVKGSTSTTSIAYGIQADLSTVAATTANLKVYNNFISNIYTSYTSTAVATRYAFGMYFGIIGSLSTHSYDIDNNSVSIGQGLTPTYSNTCIEFQSTTPVFKVRGNVFANFTGAQAATAKHFCIVTTAAGLGGTGVAFNYNDYHIATDQSTSGHIGRNNTTPTNYNLIADWKTFTTSTLDDTSISVAPTFVNNNTDLHASASGIDAVSGFTAQSWVTTDIDCDTRSTSTPSDLGADAFILTPVVVLANNGTQVAAANVSPGTTNLVLHQSQLTTTVAAASLTGMTCTTGGTYLSADITNLKAWYSTSSTFSSGTATLLSTFTTPGAAGAKTFPSFATQSVATGTGYIFITADLASAATNSNTINLSALTTSDFTFASANKSGSSTAGGAQTFVSSAIAIADNGNQVGAANISGGTSNVVLHQSQLTVSSASASLTGMTCTTAGSYVSADVTNLKVYYSTNATFSTGTSTLLSTLTTPGAPGTKTFTSFLSQAVPVGTAYIYITADISSSATNANTINVNALTTADFTFGSGSKTGSTTAGGTQTVVVPTVVLANNGTQVAASTVDAGTTNVLLHQSQLSVTNAAATLTGMTCTTAGTYASADVTNLKAWYSTSSTFNSGTATLLSTIATPGAAGTKTFTSFTTQSISSGSTGYIYLTADITAAATNANTINVSELATTNFTFSSVSISGSGSAGGLKTLRKYCASTGPSTQGSDYFTNFTITNGITNISNASTYSANGYGDFTAQSASQYHSSSVSFSMTSPGVGNGSSFGIFIDWNQNGLFTDAGESVYNSNGNISSNPSGTFSVPSGALIGNTRMRIVVQDATAAVISCNSAQSSSETEDYTFTVVAIPACAAPTSLAATASSSAQTTTSISGSFTAAGTAPSGYLVVRTDSNTQPSPVTATTYTVGSNAIGYIEYVGTSAGSWTSSSLTSGTPYYYWVFSYNNTTCSGGPVYSASTTAFSQSTVSCPGTSLAGLTYASNPVSYCTSSAITSNTVTLGTTAGTVTYSVNPPLPAGLSLNSSSGAVSGTPTTATAAGDYTITATNGCTSTTAVLNITILASPILTAVSATTPICLGNSTTLSATSAGNTISWYDAASGGNLLGTSIASYTPLATGTFTYYAQAAGSNGCVSPRTATSSVVVNPTPLVSNISTSAASSCGGAGSVVTVSSTTLATGTYTVTYSVSGSNTVASTTASMSFTAGSPGTGTFTTAALTADGNSNVVNITAISFTATSCSTSVSASTPAFTSSGFYTWTGAVSTSWNVAGNWSCNAVPTSTSNVVIPAGTANSPLINANAFCANLTVNNGAILTCNSTSFTLKPSGSSITNNGTITDAGDFTNYSIALQNLSPTIYGIGVWSGIGFRLRTLATSTNLTIDANAQLTLNDNAYIDHFGSAITNNGIVNGNTASYALTIMNASSIAGSGTYLDLLISANNATVTLANNITLSGYCTVHDAGNNATTTLAINGKTLTVGKDIVIDYYTATKYGVIDASAAGSSINCGGDWWHYTYGVFTRGTSTVTFNGSTAQTIGALSFAATTIFNNLNISNTSAPVTLALSENVAGALTVNAGSTLALSSYNLGSSTANTAPTSVQLYNGTTASTISGTGTLTLGGNVTVTASGTGTGATISCPVALGATRTFSVADASVASGDLTVSGVVSGSSNLFQVIKAGAGILTLSGANTYAGPTVVNAGTLKAGIATVVNTSGAFGVNSDVTLADVAGTKIDISGFNTQIRSIAGGGTTGGNVTLGAATLTIDGNSTNTSYAGIISGTGSIVKSNTGSLTLTGASTYSGGTTLSAGSLRINNAGSGGTSSAIGSGTLTIAGGTIDNTSGAAIALSTNNPLNLNSSFSFSGSESLNFGTGAVTMGADITLTNSTSVGTVKVLTLGGTNNNSTRSLTKAGSGTLAFGSNDVALNNLTLSAGTLVTTSGTLSLAGNYSNSGTFTHNSGTVTFNGTTQSITGATTFNNLALTNSGVKTFSSNLVVSSNLSIASGVSANLRTGGSHTSNSLTLGGLGTLNGTWGSTTSAATYKNNTYFGATTGIVTVATNTAATPTVTVTPIGTYTYNGLAQGPNAATNTGTGVVSYSYSGTPVLGTFTTGATRPVNVGSYSVTATAEASTDGFWSSASSSAAAFNISARELTITASNASKCFGTTYSLDSSAFTSSGLQNNETIGSVTLTSEGAASDSAAGSYSIVPSAAIGGTFTASNYSITYTNGTLTVNTLPTAEISAGSATTFCSGGSVVLTASSGSSYVWKKDGVAISLATAQTYTATTAGDYTVTVTNSNSCSATSAATTVTVNALPGSATSSNVTLCGTGSVTLTATDPGTGYTINWYNPAQTIQVATASLTYTTPSIITTTTYYAEMENTITGCKSENRTAVQAIVNVTNTYTGGTSGTNNDWFTAANWSCGSVPDATTNVVIPTGKEVSIIYNTGSGPAVAGTVSLEGTANLTITTGRSIVVTDNINVASTALFTVENSASLLQVNSTIANVGSIKVKKATANLGVNDCVFWSSPVQNASMTMNTFAPNSSNFYWTFNSAVVNNADATSASYSWVGVAPNATFEAGKGYYIKTPNTQQTNTPWTTEFNGTPNNGNIELVYPVEGDITERYYFVGNPYPSAISIDAFMETNAAYINKTIYLFREPNGNPGTGYSTVNKNPENVISFQSNGSGVNPSGVIPSGQGFLVRLLPTATTYKVVFNNTMRVSTSHGQFNRLATSTEDAYNLKLTAANARFSQTKVGYYENALNEEEASFDVRSMDDGAFDLGTLLNQKNFKVQARAAYNAADVIPLRFKTNVAGEHRITLSDTSGVFAADQMVIIKDNLTGVQHNLTANGDYVFTSATGTFTNRFEVVYQQAYYTALQANSCGATIANMSSLVYADIVNGATGYRFKVVNNTTAVVQTIDRPQHWFAFNMLSAYDYNTPYTISVQVQKDGVWTGYYGASCTVNSPNIAATGIMQINPSQCGMTLPTIGTVIATTPVAGATGYKFRITNTTANAMGNNLVQEITRTNHWFTLAMLARYNYGSSYAIEVAVKTTGGYTPYGNACTVYAPAVPTLASCGQTVATATTLVRTTATTLATQYRFQVTRIATQETITFDTANYWFSFRVNVPGYAAGEQYGVRVAVMTAGAWSPYGDACDITAPIATARTTEEAAPSEANLFKPVAYPNPFKSEFSIALATPFQDDVTLVVYDLQGRLIEKQTIPVTLIDTIHIGANYQMGDYMLVVSQGSAIESMLLHKE